MKSKIVDIIIELVNGTSSPDGWIHEKINNKQIELSNCSYLLNQTIRQYQIPADHYYVSRAASQYWYKYLGVKKNIVNFFYKEKVVLDSPKEYDKYIGSNKQPRRVELDYFFYNDIFHNEHIVPVKNIIEELFKLKESGKLTQENVLNTLNKIYIARILKSENIRLKSKRIGVDAQKIIDTIYKQADIELVKE